VQGRGGESRLDAHSLLTDRIGQGEVDKVCSAMRFDQVHLPRTEREVDPLGAFVDNDVPTHARCDPDVDLDCRSVVCGVGILGPHPEPIAVHLGSRPDAAAVPTWGGDDGQVLAEVGGTDHKCICAAVNVDDSGLTSVECDGNPLIVATSRCQVPDNERDGKDEENGEGDQWPDRSAGPGRWWCRDR
jgi:hypothetical protein